MGKRKDGAGEPRAATGDDAPVPTNRSERRKARHGHWGVAIDRNARARVIARAWALRRATRPGAHYGPVTAKAHDVLRAIDRFMDHETGACFPSHEALGNEAGCSRSTVQTAIKALRDLGLITWLTRYAKAVIEVVDAATGEARKRVVMVRTSNAYAMLDVDRSPGRAAGVAEWKPVVLRRSWRERTSGATTRNGPDTELRSGSEIPAGTTPAATG